MLNSVLPLYYPEKISYFSDTLSIKSDSSNKFKFFHRRCNSLESSISQLPPELSKPKSEYFVYESEPLRKITEMGAVKCNNWTTWIESTSLYHGVSVKEPYTESLENLLDFPLVANCSEIELDEIVEEMLKLDIPLGRNALKNVLKTIAIFQDRICGRNSLPATYKGCSEHVCGKTIKSRSFRLEVHSNKIMFLLFPFDAKALIASGSKKKCFKIFPIAFNPKVLARTISGFPIDSDHHQKIFAKEEKFLSLFSNYPGPETYGVHYNFYAQGKSLIRIQNTTMEFYDISLDQLINDIFHNKIVLNDQKKIRLSLLLARAVQLIRNENIFHRDIKPDNVFLTRDHDKLVLGDYGSACEKNDRESRMKTEGTDIYLSPKSLKYLFTEKYACRSSDDIWALGCTLWYLWAEEKYPWAPMINLYSAYTEGRVKQYLLNQILQIMRLYSKQIVPKKNHIAHILSNMLQYNSRSRSSIETIIAQFERLDDRYNEREPTQRLTRKFQKYLPTLEANLGLSD